MSKITLTWLRTGYRTGIGRLRRSRLPLLLLSLLRGLASRLETWLDRPESSGALPVATTDWPTAELAWRVDLAPPEAPVSGVAAPPATAAPPAPVEVAPAVPAGLSLPVILPPPPRRPGAPPPLPRLAVTPRPTPASLRAAAAARPRRGLPPGLPRRMAR